MPENKDESIDINGNDVKIGETVQLVCMGDSEIAKLMTTSAKSKKLILKIENSKQK